MRRDARPAGGARRIALVYDAVYPYSIGGAERRYRVLAERLAAAGHDVHLYGMKYWDGPRTVVEDGVTLHGLCRARPLYTAGGRRSIRQALIFGLAALQLVVARFDVIDCCGFPYFSLFSCKLAAVLRRRPLHATWHEVWGRAYWRSYLGAPGILGYAVERAAARLPSHVIAVSDRTAERLRTVLGYRGPLSVIPNGVEIERIRAVAPAATASDVLYAGRLVDFKNVDLLVRAVALLRADLPDVRCVVIGDGPERAGLERLVDETGLRGNVTFTGFVPDGDDVYALMKASRVFVLPSAREGFGIVVVEANAAGLPVVTVDLPGNLAKDLVTDGRGVVVEARAEALADGIRSQLAGRAAPEAYAGRVAGFDWSTAARAVTDALVAAGSARGSAREGGTEP